MVHTDSGSNFLLYSYYFFSSVLHSLYLRLSLSLCLSHVRSPLRSGSARRSHRIVRPHPSLPSLPFLDPRPPSFLVL